MYTYKSMINATIDTVEDTKSCFFLQTQERKSGIYMI